MKKKRGEHKTVLKERVNILKAKGYRGFHLSDEKGDLKNTIEVGARSKTGIMLIAIGDTLEEAYVNLVQRIDTTLNG